MQLKIIHLVPKSTAEIYLLEQKRGNDRRHDKSIYLYIDQERIEFISGMSLELSIAFIFSLLVMVP